MKPILAGGAGLQTGEVGYLQVQETARLEQSRNLCQRRLRVVQMLQNMPEDHRVEILFGERALLQRLGINSKFLRLCCSPSRQRRTLYPMALVSQLCKVAQQQASAAANFENSAASSDQGMNTRGSLPGHPRDKSLNTRNELDVVGTVVGFRVLPFQSGWVWFWEGFAGPAGRTGAKGAILLVQSRGAKLVSTAGNTGSGEHRAQLNCLYLMNPHLNSRYLTMVRRIDSP